MSTPLQTILLRSRAAVHANLDHYYTDVDVAFDANKNLAFTAASPKVSPLLTVHSAKMGQKIYRVATQSDGIQGVYCAVGYALANVIFVVGVDAAGQGGVVVVDTTESLEAAQLAREDFYKACPAAREWPIVAVVYTHNHTDHIGGVRAFASDEQVASGACHIIAHSTLMEAVRNNASVVAPILGARSAYSFGALLPVGEDGSVNGGIGPVLARGKTTFFAPTLTFDEQLSITLVGVRFEFRHAPSETDDEIVAYLPGWGVLLSAEVVQGECLANVHTVRGTRYRDPQQWVNTLDAMRAACTESQIQFMVPAHGRPVAGNANIAELLTAYRDAIAFIHDQAARLMNKGATPDELADELPALPPHLAQHAWLGEYYGTVKHSVRQVFTGQLGWFDGDPTTLDPLPPKDRAARWIALAGGRDALLQKIEAALSADEVQWAADLATLLVRVDNSDTTAKGLKAKALQRLGFATSNINWRNWYLTAARELMGAYDDLAISAGSGAMASPDIQAALEPSQVLGLLAVRVAAERSLDVHVYLRFEMTDTQQTITLELRRGVLQIHTTIDVLQSPADRAWPALALSKTALIELLRGGAAGFPALMQAGKLKLTQGTLPEVAAFFSYFDPRAERLPKLATR